MLLIRSGASPPPPGLILLQPPGSSSQRKQGLAGAGSQVLLLTYWIHSLVLWLYLFQASQDSHLPFPASSFLKACLLHCVLDFFLAWLPSPPTLSSAPAQPHWRLQSADHSKTSFTIPGFSSKLQLQRSSSTYWYLQLHMAPAHEKQF